MIAMPVYIAICCASNADIHIIRAGSCITGEVRLVDGANALEGRLELCISGTWGTVCNDGFDREAAMVVCRQLGVQESGTVKW